MSISKDTIIKTALRAANFGFVEVVGVKSLKHDGRSVNGLYDRNLRRVSINTNIRSATKYKVVLLHELGHHLACNAGFNSSNCSKKEIEDIADAYASQIGCVIGFEYKSHTHKI